MNNQSQVDARNIVSGKDAEIYVATSRGNIFLAEADAFQAQLNFENTDYQPIGAYFKYAVNTAASATLTTTENVIRDDLFLKPVLDDLANGITPEFTFQGKLKRRDGQYQRQVFRNCIPDGSIDLLNISAGEIIKRAWSFRINATPELLEYFES